MGNNAGDYPRVVASSELEKYPIQVLLEAILSKFGSHGAGDKAIRAKLAVLDSLIVLNDQIVDGHAEGFPHKYPRSVSIGALSSSLAAPEFHAIEYTSYGPPTRWTGPMPYFSFNLFVDRSAPLYFSLDFELVYFTRSLEELRCFVDGHPVELKIEKKGGGYLASGALPPRETSGGSVITFVCPEMRSPRENDLPDDRLLGVRCRRMDVDENAPPPIATAAEEPEKEQMISDSSV